MEGDHYMNYGMDRICQLDASQKGTFIHPANRIIRARMQMHDRYHEHPTQPDCNSRIRGYRRVGHHHMQLFGRRAGHKVPFANARD